MKFYEENGIKVPEEERLNVIKTFLKQIKKLDFNDALRILTFNSWDEKTVSESLNKKITITRNLQLNMFKYLLREGDILAGRKKAFWKEFIAKIPAGVRLLR